MKVCSISSGIGKASFESLIAKEMPSKENDGYKAPTMRSNIRKGKRR